ncbi:class I mannose-6-phosphate isomerase [Sinomicrobium weinanense]|uniref:Class I mannose-6-phosphate isomerase n=1 Tax=Sinomicrobium weinanense TaxID=2842200 RepID=A0A926JUS2_9FLAO|nr:class I mannose-6-phosphate isomerase [Sinomicrobium weinanense]MBC9797938.1 class I mannose-6-phosphate isomerase [Sinomicrobium weinanense]MBU3123270.1 class I mannose-6-phosphate isomerase [Sinomicrobium weinanense]
MRSNYDKYPKIHVSENKEECIRGWEAIAKAIKDKISAKNGRLIAVETYQGVDMKEAGTAFKKILNPGRIYYSSDALKPEGEIKKMVYPYVTDDRVFGYMTDLGLKDFFDPESCKKLKAEVGAGANGLQIILGPGAVFCCPDADLLVYMDMPRWELQLRMRKNEVSNLGTDNKHEEFALRVKQSFFVDWRVLDRHKLNLFDRIDFFVDTVEASNPKMLSGESLNRALEVASRQPFRVVPFFDPGPWGGQWLKEVIDLDRNAVNFAWGFDCVPEENSLLFEFGGVNFETPAINLVLTRPLSLLGQRVFEKFGAEFPIRFDFLDTMKGGNLSLQVHPTKEYIREQFGMPYTQDESYYILDAGEDAEVYLGIKDETVPEEMLDNLKKARSNGGNFNADVYINKWPVKKHDHYLIPSGTIHCSGANSVVLEISATPYIFTFKLWDWGRLGLDGKPRPIHIEHGEHVIDWSRRKQWTRENLVNQIEETARGEGWTEEKTGLHPSGFIETHRHWFTGKVTHHTGGSVNVINLVEGREAIVESPEGKFDPFVVHYAETFIVPAAVGDYTIRPAGESAGKKCATLKAFVREMR